MNIIFVSALALLLSGCSDVSLKTESIQEPAYIATNLCEIRRDRSAWIGKIVRVNGVFISDGMTFGYFEDKSCGESSNTVRLSTSNESISDASVAAIDRYLLNACQGSASGYCEENVAIDAAGLVSENDEGLLRLELIHVYDFYPVKGS